ncbi:type IX secretion system membrane protein PorP/SprF [Zhouia sp. PK063]|uniref:type IX secretion system membrane protein PorP/SprF n=1 Tax=Zhouia sp. PK063 TaxID=3373602 RepID=UPI003794C7AE
MSLYIKKLLCIFLLCLAYLPLKAQEGLPVYFDYLSDNWYLIHPAMAGVGQGGKIRLTARKQWFDVEKAPALQTLSAHMRVGDRSGVGTIFFNDRNGYHSQTGAKFTYAHHIMFSRSDYALNQLSFGLSVGFIQSSLDESEFVSTVPDPIITGTNNSVSYFNVDFGMSYNYLEFYAHFTVKNALGSGRDLYTAEEFDNLRRYLISVGYVFGNTEWQYEPSFLVQYGEYSKETTTDLNMKVYRQMDFGKIWGGLSYRRGFSGTEYDLGNGVQTQHLQLWSPILGVNYKNLMIAYTYTYQSGDIRFDNGGFHQITLGFDFGSDRNRFNCHCPAANY